jgi:hypothetical protein
MGQEGWLTKYQDSCDLVSTSQPQKDSVSSIDSDKDYIANVHLCFLHMEPNFAGVISSSEPLST